MKTGGTLNFLKRAGAIFMLLAIFASSCNKYADDFDQINTKLDALATSVAGVAQLTTDMSALKSQVTALQAAVASLPTKTQTDASFAALTTSLSGITTKVDAITTALAAVATTGTATKAVVDQLKLDLAALATKVTNDNAAMTTQLNGLAGDNVTMKANLQTIIAANTALATQITAVQDQITALVDATGTDATAVTIKGLQLMLEAQKVTLDQLLANSNMYNGNVNITSDAEVAFWLPKIGVWKDGGMVNGKLVINTTSITSLVDLKTITDNILAVIGGAGSDAIFVTTPAKPLTFAKLASVTGDYVVIGADVDDSALTTVGGDVALTYDGGYDQPNLSAVGGNIILVDYATAAGPPAIAGTLKVDFSGLSNVALPILTGTFTVPLYSLTVTSGVAGTCAFSSAVSVALGEVAYINVTANKANTVNLAWSPGMGVNTTVVATKAGSTITLGVTETVGANLTITGSATSVVNLPDLEIVDGDAVITSASLAASNLERVYGVLDLISTTTVTLPALTSVTGATTANSATGFSAPLFNVSATVNLLLAKDVTVLSTTQALLSAAVVENLTLGALDVVFTTSATSPLKTVNVTGKAAGNGAFTYTVPAAAGNSLLASATFGGELDAVVVNGFGAATDKLTSLTTTGAIDALTLSNSDVITSVSLGHTHIAGGPGSSVTITGNAKLASLTTSTDKMSKLVVTSNALLAAMDFSSYVNLLNHNGAIPTDVTVTINSNKLAATFTPAVAATPTTPYSEAIIQSASIASLKGYLAAVKASLTLTSSVAIDIDDVDPTAGVVLLSSAMGSNDAVSVAIDNTAGINAGTEIAILVP